MKDLLSGANYDELRVNHDELRANHDEVRVNHDEVRVNHDELRVIHATQVFYFFCVFSPPERPIFVFLLKNLMSLFSTLLLFIIL